MFAIRHKPTGKLLSDGGEFNQRDVELTDQGIPRLFTKKGHAQRSLWWWMTGPTGNRYFDSVPRVAADMDIVQVEVVVVY